VALKAEAVAVEGGERGAGVVERSQRACVCPHNDEGGVVAGCGGGCWLGSRGVRRRAMFKPGMRGVRGMCAVCEKGRR